MRPDAILSSSGYHLGETRFILKAVKRVKGVVKEDSSNDEFKKRLKQKCQRRKDNQKIGKIWSWVGD